MTEYRTLIFDSLKYHLLPLQTSGHSTVGKLREANSRETSNHAYGLYVKTLKEAHLFAFLLLRLLLECTFRFCVNSVQH